MAEEQPSLHIDTDWKKQAQAEKRRLAEEAAKRAASAPLSEPAPTAAMTPAPAPGAMAGSPGMTPMPVPSRRRGPRGEAPPATFASLVQSVMTQALFYLGDLATSGGQGMLDLDMAKHQLDTLNVLEEKTKGNLSSEEKTLLDSILYEVRMRFVRVASEYLGP